MGPADGSDRLPDAARPAGRRFRVDAETFGIGAVLAAVGIRCATTLVTTGIWAGIIVTLVGLLTGVGRSIATACSVARST